MSTPATKVSPTIRPFSIAVTDADLDDLRTRLTRTRYPRTPADALERLVLYSGSHCGDVIEEPNFGELERELKIIVSSPDPDVRDFAIELAELIRVARREKNPIVF